MTNEQYMQVSYFAAAGAGVAVALVTIAILARPHGLATAGAAAGKLGAVLRRVFPTWLMLAVLLGFMSVSYFDCDHTNYEKIVADREHLIDKSQEQASSMLTYLAIAVTAYGFALILFLWARARPMRTAARRPDPPARPKPPSPLRPLPPRKGRSGLPGALGCADTS